MLSRAQTYTKRTLCSRACVGAIVILASISVAGVQRSLTAQDLPFQDPATAMQAMFERMAENAGPMKPLFGRMTPQQLEQLDAIKVSTVEESQYGRKVLDGFIKTMKQQRIEATSRFPESAYLSKLVAGIRPQMDNAKRYPRLQIYLIETESEDADSVPGGHLLVTRGLLDKIESEAALVGVLAHELSHMDRGHQLLPLKQSKLVQQPLNFSDSMLMISLVARPFRPEQETEADADATRWMMAIGYQPLELARMLNRWNQQQAATMPWQKFVPGFVKSHPDAELRALEVAKLADQHKRKFPDATYVGRENLKRRIAKSEQRFPR